jgi:hypothetical protein
MLLDENASIWHDSQSIGAQLKPGFGELRIALEIHRFVALKHIDHISGELEPGGSHLHFYENNTIFIKSF